MSYYQPKTGQPCDCKRGLQRDNCPACKGTGMRMDFAAVRARNIGRESMPRTRHDLLPGDTSHLYRSKPC